MLGIWAIHRAYIDIKFSYKTRYKIVARNTESNIKTRFKYASNFKLLQNQFHEKKIEIDGVGQSLATQEFSGRAIGEPQ